MIRNPLCGRLVESGEQHKGVSGLLFLYVSSCELDLLTQHSPADADTLKAITARAGTPSFSDEADASTTKALTTQLAERMCIELQQNYIGLLPLDATLVQGTIWGKVHTVEGKDPESDRTKTCI